MTTSWMLELETPPEAADAVDEWMREAGAMAVAIADAGRIEDRGPEDPFDRCRVTGFFPAEQDRPETERRLRLLVTTLGLPGDCPVDWRELADEDWLESWKGGLTPQAVGKSLLIQPTWLETPPGNDRRLIRIDPEMAFGSGSHETTQGCLEALEARAAVEGLGEVLDLGTGSGILAIGAALLGADSVTATDNDPIALETARRNWTLNLGAEDKRARFIESAQPPEGRFRTVVANILAPALLAMLAGRLPGDIANTPARALGDVLVPGGCVILSGILGSEIEKLSNGCRRAGLSEVEARRLGEWAVVTARL